MKRINLSIAFFLLFGLCALSSVKAQDPTFGPCDCRPRGTLFQWSYGTSFSGGPDLDAPLVTDRPDFTEASSTVGRGVAQLEFGYTFTHNADGASSTTSHSIGEPLLRYGVLADWLELRIGWNYANQTTIAGGVGTSVRGAEDLYLGYKIGLTPQEEMLPEMALIPHSSAVKVASWISRSQSSATSTVVSSGRESPV